MHNTLPRNEDGTINTSAAFGAGPVLVEITWNTDPAGLWADNDTNRTLHGPFVSLDEATTWMNAYPDDTDIREMITLETDGVRPTCSTTSTTAPPPSQALAEAFNALSNRWLNDHPSPAGTLHALHGWLVANEADLHLDSSA